MWDWHKRLLFEMEIDLKAQQGLADVLLEAAKPKVDLRWKTALGYLSWVCCWTL
jgi:hypothetical protein